MIKATGRFQTQREDIEPFISVHYSKLKGQTLEQTNKRLFPKKKLEKGEKEILI